MKIKNFETQKDFEKWYSKKFNSIILKRILLTNGLTIEYINCKWGN